MSAPRTAPQQPQPATGDAPVHRYSVRAETPDGNKEVGLGTNQNAEIAFARSYHERYGCKVWVWDMTTGRTIFRIERGRGAEPPGGEPRRRAKRWGDIVIPPGPGRAL